MKVLQIITVLMIPFLHCRAQTNVDPGIVFDSTVFHFGMVKKGSSIEHTFSFVNRSKTSVVISNVRTYCGCIAVSWTKGPIKPDESGEIKVKYHALATGTFSKTVKVFTNLSNRSTDITVKGQCW
jgi:hypothetical protein